MYANHVPVIAAAMRSDVATFERGVMFAILSARVQFRRVPHAMRELKAHGESAPCLWGFKRGAYEYLRANRDLLWRETCAAIDPEVALRSICRIPGLGIIKGAFVCQMLGHDIACLDTRNVTRENRSMRQWTAYHKSAPGFWKALSRYVAETNGRARELWDTWCEEVAHDYGTTGAAISEIHLREIVPRKLRNITPLAVPFAAPELPF